MKSREQNEIYLNISKITMSDYYFILFLSNLNVIQNAIWFNFEISKNKVNRGSVLG